MKKLIFIILISAIIIIPVISSAVDLEQQYPNLSATKAISETSSIAELVNYISTWGIILAVIAVIISLIISGIQYLTSAGRPGAMTEAKARIYKSFLGLAILVASYLILVTINPQLTLLQIEYVPVDSGLFIFSEQGYTEFINGGPSNFNDLVGSNKIYPLTHDMPNMTLEFELGGLVVERGEGDPLAPAPIELVAEKVNFLNTPLYAIGFWGALEQDAKVIMYSQENFEGDKNEYALRGKLDSSGDVKRGSGSSHGMHIIVFSEDFDPVDPTDPNSKHDADFFKTSAADPKFYVDYINLKASEYNSLREEKQQEIQMNLELARNLTESPLAGAFDYVISRHDTDAIEGLVYPPLSLKIRRTGPGVYLYANEIDNNTEERMFLESQENLGREDIDFAERAEKIKIINKKITYDESGTETIVPSQSKDYLVTLHEDEYLTGNLRIFFKQELDDSESIPRMCSNGKPAIAIPAGGISCGFDSFDPVPQDALTGYLEGISYYPSAGPEQLVIGNAGSVGVRGDTSDDVEPRKMLVDIDVGIKPTDSDTIAAEKVKYGALEYVSSLDIYELSEDPTVCREVRICTKKGWETGEFGGDGNCISYSYKGSKTISNPELGVVKYPMPLYEPVNVPEKAWVVKSKYDDGGDKDGEIKELEEKDFAQKIKSLHIMGDCLVALFENKIEEWKDGFPVRGPGPHSQAFYGSRMDLEKEEIGRCGTRLRRIAGRYLAKPCTQAIAIYPIKKRE